MTEEFKVFFVTLNSGAPGWLTSKWRVEAKDTTQALHYATLLHQNVRTWRHTMLTVSELGANPDLDPGTFCTADFKTIDRLDRIYQHSLVPLENC